MISAFPESLMDHVKSYQWELDNDFHGLELTINHDESFKLSLQTVTEQYDYNELEFKCDKYQTSNNPICRIILERCTNSIAHEIAYDLMERYKPHGSCLLKIKTFPHDDGYPKTMWLKCKFIGWIEISLFHPDIHDSFTIREENYMETYNYYDDQYHRIHELAKISKIYDWLLKESLRYFTPLIIDELKKNLELPSPLISMISEYILS